MTHSGKESIEIHLISGVHRSEVYKYIADLLRTHGGIAVIRCESASDVVSPEEAGCLDSLLPHDEAFSVEHPAAGQGDSGDVYISRDAIMHLAAEQGYDVSQLERILNALGRAQENRKLSADVYDFTKADTERDKDLSLDGLRKVAEDLSARRRIPGIGPQSAAIIDDLLKAISGDG